MENRVERVRTNVSEPEMAQAIIEAWRDMFGATPTKAQVSIILAQNNLETGHRKNMWNYNVGNITHRTGDGFDYWTGLDWLYDYFTDTSGFTQKQKKTITLKYRAYPDLKSGVEDYLKFLKSKHYADAWQHIVNPDPVAYSKALKAAGYYTADESSYTSGMKNLFNQANKSNSYELAQQGRTQIPSNTQLPINTNVENILDKYIQLLSAATTSTYSLKKLYKLALPNNDILIQLQGDYTDAIEFARILSTALDEDLLSTSHIHTDGSSVEIECSIPGPSQLCFDAVEQMAKAISSAFKTATKKIGGISINTNCIMNKKSYYQLISLKKADANQRKFLLKFIKG